MITVESIKDILDANAVRTADGREPLLTEAGTVVLHRLLRIMAPIPQKDIDDIIRGSLKE